MHDRCNCNHSSDDGKLFTGLVIGGLIGAGLAIYFSTDQGKEKIAQLKGKVQEYGEGLQDKFDEVKAEKIDPLLEEAKAEFENTVKRIRSGAQEAKTKKA